MDAYDKIMEDALEKRWEEEEKFREGKWAAPVPPVCTAGWGVAEWIKWVNAEGVWT